MRNLKPTWIRPWGGSNIVRLEACGGRSHLIEAVPDNLRKILEAGGSTTLMVWADLDHDMPNGETLKNEFWIKAEQKGITRQDFDQIVFVFPKDRIENWIQFLNTGITNESEEGPRLRHDRLAADAAVLLANHCLRGAPIQNIPPSLEWSCRNWRSLVARMR